MLVLCRPPIIEDCTGARTIVYQQRGCRQPLLKIVERDGNVLSVVPIEDPDLAGRSWLGHPMSIIVEQNTLVFGLPPHVDAETLSLFDRWIGIRLQLRPRTVGLKLLVHLQRNLIHDLLVLGRCAAESSILTRFRPRTWVGADDIWRVDSQVQADGQCSHRQPESLAHLPLWHSVQRVSGCTSAFVPLVVEVHEEVAVQHFHELWRIVLLIEPMPHLDRRLLLLLLSRGGGGGCFFCFSFFFVIFL